jgi:cytoskeletal protein CcmA (bactofilin family)
LLQSLRFASRHELGYSSGSASAIAVPLEESKKLTKPAEGSTVIGKSVIIRGDLSGNEDLYIDGDVEGTVTLSESRLTIGPNAHVQAAIHVRDIIILGQLTGNVTATGRVDLRQSAVVNGDIVADRLSIEESATIKGRVELKASPEAKSTPASRPAPAPEANASNAPLFSKTEA